MQFALFNSYQGMKALNIIEYQRKPDPCVSFHIKGKATHFTHIRVLQFSFSCCDLCSMGLLTITLSNGNFKGKLWKSKSE